MRAIHGCARLPMLSSPNRHHRFPHRILIPRNSDERLTGCRPGAPIAAIRKARNMNVRNLIARAKITATEFVASLRNAAQVDSAPIGTLDVAPLEERIMLSATPAGAALSGIELDPQLNSSESSSAQVPDELQQSSGQSGNALIQDGEHRQSMSDSMTATLPTPDSLNSDSTTTDELTVQSKN